MKSLEGANDAYRGGMVDGSLDTLMEAKQTLNNIKKTII